MKVPKHLTAADLDHRDPLNKFREQFFIGDNNTIYLDGNSLGRLPIATKSLLNDVVENQWGTELIESWNKHWYHKSEELGNKIAQIIGASDGEVVVSDSTSINLYKLSHAALKLQHNKTEIVSDCFNFPTDLYILQGLCKEFGDNHRLILADTINETEIDIEDLKNKITDNTALVVLSLVAFKSSFLYDANEITQYVHQKGAMVLWDLSHAAGAIPVKLNQTNADLAIGCTYKYLNGGPGSPAFLYVRKDLQNKISSPIQGWFGDAQPFAFNLNYRAASGIRRFLSSTPPVLNLMAIEPGIDMIIDAGMGKIHHKSQMLSEYFIFLAKEYLDRIGFKIGSPGKIENRGSHVALKHPEAYRICQSLIHPKKTGIKIIPDFREPDNIRFGFTPLYTSFNDLYQTVQRLEQIVTEKEFEKHPNERQTVT